MPVTLLLDRRALNAALLGGLLAATLDLLYACSVYAILGVSPLTILQSIASGWLGDAAYQGGMATGVLGLLSHFSIVCVTAILYGVICSRFAVMNLHPVSCGAAFGTGIFVAMNYVVVPLSASSVNPPRGWLCVGGLLVHMFLIGVPIALFARTAAGPRGKA